MGVQIVGVGFGPTPVNAIWVADQSYQFEVWNDVNKTLAVYYGAASSPSAFAPSRITRLLDSTGAVLLEYNTVAIGAHPAEVLADCELIFGSNP